MTVKELKDHLKVFPDDIKIILSKDSEGNGFGPLWAVEDALFDGEDVYYPEELEYPERLDPDLEEVVVFWNGR